MSHKLGQGLLRASVGRVNDDEVDFHGEVVTVESRDGEPLVTMTKQELLDLIQVARVKDFIDADDLLSLM